MAPQYGLSTDDVTTIFSDQMEANKEVQYALLGNWRRAGNAPSTPRQSLTNVIRPELDELQVSILQDLQAVAVWRGTTVCPTQIPSLQDGSRSSCRWMRCTSRH